MTEPRYDMVIPAPDEVRAQIEAINKFQEVVRATLIPGLDYGIIPGTSKPTLLKPGAEKIIKLLQLADQYDFIDRLEDWSKPFFRYLIRCRLSRIGTDAVITEGFGECNSLEPKYKYRWLFQSNLPPALQGDAGKLERDKLVIKTIPLKKGEHAKQYRQDNDEIPALVNTLVKMARKRALVDAALTAGRLSQLFTQDTEDMDLGHGATQDKETPPPAGDPLESGPVDRSAIETMLKSLMIDEPKKWTEAKIIDSLNKRSGQNAMTIPAAIAGLSSDQAAIVYDLTRGYIINKAGGANQ